ncbi:IS481 family transposase [Oceanithermus profundus]
MDLRYELMKRLEAGERVTDLAREYGVSRKTIYKFKERWERSGLEGLRDLRRRPHRLARRLPKELEEAVLCIKREHPTWGAKKIREMLPRRFPSLPVPAHSTIYEILKRHGLVRRRRKRTPLRSPCEPLQRPAHSNHIWAADFKGHFRLQDASYCYPLTVSDLHSRFVLLVEALSSTAEEAALEAFAELFRSRGLPERIRVDNGVPFCSAGNWGLSRLRVLWMRLGITVERIQPGQPQQNGIHERMHRTLKAECARPAARHLLAQQQRFDEFVHTFNLVRPHEALGMDTPAQHYESSPRPCPERLPEPEYPLADLVRTVNSNGTVTLFQRHTIFLAAPLRGQIIGLQEQPDGRWVIAFARHDLGIYDPIQRRFRPFEHLRPSIMVTSEP